MPSNNELTELAAVPGVAKPDPVMVVDSLQRHFGGLVAVNISHLEIARGKITALIGPNGAGKTTAFNLLTGFDRPNRGSWTYIPTQGASAKSLRGLPAYRVARHGVVRTFQLTKALSKMSVLDNMRLAAVGQRGEHLWSALLPFSWYRQEKIITARAQELLARFKLDAKAKEYAGTLSGGQRKLLEMARALMAEPKVIMLDEPMAGVNPALTQNLLEHIKQLRAEGMTVVFVEHDMDVVRDISDWAVVMAQGAVIAEGPPATVTSDPAVIDAYLGAHHDAPSSAAEEKSQIEAAEVELKAEASAASKVVGDD